jgi:NitT/TauT family transport system permease protein
MKRMLANAGPPLLLLATVLIVWQVAVSALRIPPLLLPTPLRIADTLVHQWDRLLIASGRTAAAAVAGFAISLLFGTGIAMLFAQAPWVRRCCFPYAIFLQTVPIVAIAPVIVTWVGEGFAAVVIVATIISLFPIITNVTEGMTSIPLGLQEVFALYRASRWQTLWHLQFPHSLPQLVLGARIAAGSSVLGAIVGEIFAGVAQKNPGLGFVIFAASDQFNMAFVFAAIAATTLLGISLFALVTFVGDRYLLHWRDRRLHERS